MADISKLDVSASSDVVTCAQLHRKKFQRNVEFLNLVFTCDLQRARLRELASLRASKEAETKDVETNYSNNRYSEKIRNKN